MANTYPQDKANQAMPGGKYKNKLVRNIPLTYLTWLNRQGSSNTLYQWLYSETGLKDDPSVNKCSHAK